ncbi:hypothetical protein PVK06_005126 [Gossypium arboreum]|uniref:Uncharacterized protein n=1 Tax=Gossypium arboreum TaxID=29729 RepID=A0ABR0QV14_GOSAR|nr:hypothetical protein PVK06_005126 [Gossypium arboreum]
MATKIASTPFFTDAHCPCYGSPTQTVMHDLCDCLLSYNTLTLASIKNGLLHADVVSCIDWLEMAMMMLYKATFIDLLVLRWNLWNEHNNGVMKGHSTTPRLILDWAKRLNNEL